MRKILLFVIGLFLIIFGILFFNNRKEIYDTSNLKKYEVEFRDGFGNTIKKVIVKDGVNVKAPKISDRVGYNFAGWDKSYDSINDNMVINAIWNPKKVNVIFHINIDNDNRIYEEVYTYDINKQFFGMNLLSNEKDFGDFEYEGYYLIGWSRNSDSNSSEYSVFESVSRDFIEKSSSKVDLYGVWIKKDIVINVNKNADKKHQVVFKDGFGNNIKNEEVKNNKNAVAPKPPKKEGYKFTGWDKEYSSIVSDTEINATWDDKKSNNSTNVVEKNNNDSKKNDSSTNVDEQNNNKDNNISPSNNKKTYIVKFTDGLGKTIKTETVKKGGSASKPKNPERVGYKFTGWDKSFSKVNSNITVNAKWKAKEIKVIFHYNVSNSNSTYTEVYTYDKKNQSFGMNLKTKSGSFGTWKNNGYSLLGWSSNKKSTKVEYSIYSSVNNSFINSKSPSINLYAIWKKGITYTVKFTDGLGKTIKTETIKAGGSASKPKNPERVGYIFTGWDKKINKINSNITVNAKWKAKEIKVIFHYNVSNSNSTYTEVYTYDKKNQSFGMNLKTKSGSFGTWKNNGYDLLGWSRNKSSSSIEWVTYSGVSNDWINTHSPTINLYAIWKKSKYTVIFMDGFGNKLSTSSVEYMGSVKAPTIPFRKGYIFNGWNKSFTNIKGNLIVDATWKAKEVKVIFHYNVTNNNSTYTEVYTYGKKNQSFGMNLKNKSGSFGTWVYSNYSLLGWNRNKSASNIEWLTYSGVSDDWINTYSPSIHLYAIWRKNNFTVKFSDGLGKILKSEIVNYGKNATAPSNPTREGYNFVGWDKSYNNIKGDIVVTAKWSIKKYTVTFKTQNIVFKKETVEHGKSATPPNLPSTYTLVSWDKSYNNIKSDLVVTANYWWSNKYYKAGLLQKGLQKINNKWYLLNKNTGEKEQEGNNILVGTWYNEEKPELTRFYIGLDGHNFNYSDNFYEIMGRHMSFIDINGVFYGTKTMVRNNLRNAYNPAEFSFDFGIRSTSFSTTKFKSINWSYSKYSEYYQWHLPKGAYVNINSLNRNTPEWFVDGNKKYIFYSVDTIGDDKKEPDNDDNKRFYEIYRTEILSIMNNDYNTTKEFLTMNASTPVKMTFDILPNYKETDNKKGFTHPVVVKDGNTYVMFVKDEHENQADQNRGEAIWVYKSSDLLNWKYIYKISKNVLPHSLTTRTDPITGLEDIDKNTNKPREFYRYYSSPYVIKIGNTWHLYVEELTLGSTYRVDYEDMFTGKIIHLTSSNLFDNSWVNKGFINVGKNRVRAGSIMMVRDTKSEEIIKNTYNK